MSDDPIELVVTNCTPGDATALAEAVVSERLAACVNIIGGVRSFYVWEGTLHDEAESTLLIKTSASVREYLVSRLVQLHPYTTPEIIVVDPKFVDSHYAAWVRANTGPE